MTFRGSLGRRAAQSDRYRLVQRENAEPPKRKVLGVEVPASSVVPQLSE